MIMLLMGLNHQVKAQSNETFEGEITFETYENYSDIFKKMSNSIYFDGVHKQRLIMKGNRMHLIDETTKCHIVADNNVLQTVLNGGKSNENGRISYEKVGVIRPVKGKIKDNRYLAEEDTESMLDATEFEVVSGENFVTGMLIREK